MKLMGKATAKKTLTGKISGCEKIYISADTSDATATEDDIAIDKTAYIRSGKTTGKLPIETAIEVDGNASLDEQGKIQIAGIFDDKRAILEKNASISMSAPASDFGDATAEDVAKGKKFTSADGLNVTGTRETFIPAGTRVITMNGTHYIADYEYAQVEVAAGGDVVGGEDIEIGSLSELHQWSKYTIGGTVNETVQDSVYVDLAQKGNVDGRVYYADKYSIVDGALTLNNPTLVDLYNSPEADRKAILGKYINPVKSGGYYLVPRDAAITRSAPATGYHYVSIAPVYKVEYTGAGGEFVGIVVSEDSNAYPQSGEQDGYKYVYNGTLDDAVKEPVLQSATVTPSEMEWTVIPGEGYDGLSQVTVKAISETYVGSGITRKAAQTYTPGDTAQEIPAGVYLTGKQTINPVPTQSKTATGNGTVTPDAGKYLSSVVVDVPQSGVELPTLSNPGVAEDLLAGKELIDANGNVVTGTVVDKRSILDAVNINPVVLTVGSHTYIMHQYTPSKTMMVRDVIKLCASIDKFGTATAADVAKGKTFTSQNGLKVVGTHECEAGVELPTLDTPGTAEDLASGKQLIDANGNVVTGSVAEYDYQVGWKNRTPTIDGDSDIKFSINTTVPYLFRKGVYLSSPLSNFGDATAADVRAGKTFTSAEGLTVVGTNTLRDIKTITIKEV